jgi:hypothetical protein
MFRKYKTILRSSERISTYDFTTLLGAAATTNKQLALQRTRSVAAAHAVIVSFFTLASHLEERPSEENGHAYLHATHGLTARRSPAIRASTIFPDHCHAALDWAAGTVKEAHLHHRHQRDLAPT